MPLDTSITDSAFEDGLMERWRSTPRRRRGCDTCAHNGCCVDLPHCGGRRWMEAVAEDAEDGGEDEEERAPDPYDGPDERDRWEHDSEVWQAQADRRW